jgi:hypothetical protein
MHKIVHETFEIDLTSLQMTIIEQNRWYNDQFFTKFSFPFEIALIESLKPAFSHLTSHQATNVESLFEVIYVHDGVMEKAVLDIEQIITDNLISGSLSFGFEEIPNFNKRLADLPLQKIDLGEDGNIYEYAATIIGQTWPAVNFNYPMIHTDKYDTSGNYEHFQKIFNKYAPETGFVENEVVSVGDVSITFNRNIMQPVVYLMHILTVGFLDAGYTLVGDATQNDLLKKIAIFGDVNYVKTVEMNSYFMLITSEDFVTHQWVPVPNSGGLKLLATYHGEMEILLKGKYNLVGVVTLRLNRWLPTILIIKYRGEIVYQLEVPPTGLLSVNWHINMNLFFETVSDGDPDMLTVDIVEAASEGITKVDLEAIPVRLNDDEGGAIPTILNEPVVDLRKAVPDKTWGDFLKWAKNKYNLDFEPVGNHMVMSLVESQMNYDADIDLTEEEVQNPPRKLNKGISFLLKFDDVDKKEFALQPVFHSAKEISNDESRRDEKTQEIRFNELPLPLYSRDGIQTAYMFDGGEERIYTLIYDGLTGGYNLAKDPAPMLLNEVHQKYWKKWLTNRIDATQYTWAFKMFSEKLRNLKVKGKVYAYKRYHIVKSVSKDQIGPDLWEVTIETETIK